MAQRRSPRISFLEMSPNNRRGHVAMMLGLKPFELTKVETEVVDNIIHHAADTAEQTMQRLVDALLALRS